MTEMMDWVCIMQSGDVVYVGEYDMSDWDKGYSKMYKDARSIAKKTGDSIGHLCDTGSMIDLTINLINLENEIDKNHFEKPNRRFAKYIALYEENEVGGGVTENEFDMLKKLADENPNFENLQYWYKDLTNFLDNK